jgi:hypothetical protein
MKNIQVSDEQLHIIRLALQNYLKELGQRSQRGALGHSLTQYFSKEVTIILSLQAQIQQGKA